MESTSNFCAPNIDVTNHYTCFEEEELRQIATAFNRFIQDNKRVCNKRKCVPRKTINIQNKSKKELWYSIYNRLNKICDYEYCWVDQKFIDIITDKNLREKLKYFTFKPKGTTKRKSWLSTININQVVQQYQELDKTFEFLGALPSDFYTQLKVDYNMFKKYKRLAVIFNLDTHDQPGSHWVTLFIDNTIKTMEYFDSTGNSPNEHISKFIHILRKLLPNYSFLVNKQVHQSKNSECGVYAIYYIVQRLLGNNFEKITSNIIKDEDMSLFRDVIFRPN